MNSPIKIEQRTDSNMTYDSWIVFKQMPYGKIVYADVSSKKEAEKQAKELNKK